jgi:phytoene desaturase
MKIVVIGAGFGGLATAALLAKEGHKVTLLEKNNYLGGRAKVTKTKGYTFDMGPSWYMMPDLFERYFKLFNKKPSDYYKIKRLEPSYEVFAKDKSLIMGDYKQSKKSFANLNKNDASKLRPYLLNGKNKYEFAKKYYLFNNYSNISKLPFQSLPALVAQNPLVSYNSFVNKYFEDSLIRHAMKFMTVFLGGSPKSISSLYSLLGYADMDLGIWYPVGGFGSVVKGFEKLNNEYGVEIKKQHPVEKIIINNGNVKGVKANNKIFDADIVISNADYYFTEKYLIKNEQYKSYSSKYWKKLSMSPSAILIFLGVNKKIPGLKHHSLFFDSNWEEHFKSIEEKTILTDPLFYVSTPSKSDNTVSPKNKENLFILIPTPSGVKPTKQEINSIYKNVISRMENNLKTKINDYVDVKIIKDLSYFENEFNSYQGSSFGASHTTTQSAILRPRLKSKKVKGLYYVGQYTNPGTGVPLVISSAELVKDYINEEYRK